MIPQTHRVHGHFGEWIQGRLSPDGAVALITLPCPVLWVDIGTKDSAHSPRELFTADQLSRFRRALRLGNAPWPQLCSNIPPGCGAGASTATLMALAIGAGFSGSRAQLARACLEVEGASDPLMWPDPDGLIWASRAGRILARLPPPPPCIIVGGYWGDAECTDPRDSDFPDITDLIAPWRAAAKARDLAQLARLATVSADRCTTLRGTADPMADMAAKLGALGALRAHTGSARGLIFRPGAVPDDAEVALENAGLRGVFRFATGVA